MAFSRCVQKMVACLRWVISSRWFAAIGLLRLVFRFNDGSVDDETAVFSQRGNFQLITDHHIQKGPSFPQPMDLSIDVRSGEITVRSTGKDGKEEITTEHMDLPPDLVNGLILSITKNIRLKHRRQKYPWSWPPPSRGS